ncbi:MAG: hypothetical protein ABI658_14740 [Acidimicrobiales bacterium]
MTAASVHRACPVGAPHVADTRVLDAVGALDRLAHANHLFVDLDAAVAHAQLHVARLPVG